ncbi:hypothetical protein [Dyadobacter sandarakinus]|uniref:Uncharacterized protein n=1 Tax=Dyadobacter sandarakinus TaxID=2747268 RepID=A0ABX7I8H4_9BACT|nr:hypothetical protein [Dyadobacter sandarakinus]QRR02411.1 hypothetical protein HWI92_16585 [Dyadobacter sandarakinus]
MNNTYLKRHRENLLAAEFLLTGPGHFCSSIHCSYYAVFQLILHIHKTENTYIYRDRDKLDRQGSHDRMINETFEMIELRDKVGAGKFIREMRALKKNRVTADYQENYMDKAWGQASFGLARSLTTLLQNIFE